MTSELRILLIEDDQDDIDLFRYALRTNDVACELEIIMQGDQVAPYLSDYNNQPDVIVMDLNLPMVHGRDVLKHIKASRVFKDIPLMVLTTSSTKEDREYCYAMGANKFITKPTTVAEFGRLISAVVNLVAHER